MKTTILKVTSILMIVFGILAALIGILAIVGLSALAAYGGGLIMGMLYLSSILVIVSAIIQIIAGVRGLSTSKTLNGAEKCVFWGIVIIVITVISTILSLIGGGEFSFINIITSFAIPVLYTYGAVKIKNNL